MNTLNPELLLSQHMLFLLVGTIVAVCGILRLLLTTDLTSRLVALNVVGMGSLLVLLALASRSTPTDPVLAALVITGLVITVAFTGVGAVLIRWIEGRNAHEPNEQEPPTNSSPESGTPESGGRI